MQANAKHVYTKPGEACHYIAKHGQDGCSALTNKSAPARMKNDRVPEDNRQCTVFLRVPAPKATPGLIGPDPAKNGAHQTEECRKTNNTVHHAAERLRSVFVKRGGKNAAQDIEHAEKTRQKRPGISKRDRDNMSRQPD